MFRSRAERKVAEAGYDPARLPPGQYLTEKWPVLHAGDVPTTRPTSRAGTSGVYGRGRRPAHPHVGRARCAPEGRGHAGHPLRDALEPVRHDLRGRAVVGDPRARRAARRARTTRSRTQRRDTPRTCRRRSSTRRVRCSRRTPTASRSRREHGWPLRLVDPRQVLLEEREVAARDRATPRPTRRGSGSATATTTTPTPGKSSGTPSSGRCSCGPKGDAFRDLPRRRRGSERRNPQLRIPACEQKMRRPLGGAAVSVMLGRVGTT